MKVFSRGKYSEEVSRLQEETVGLVEEYINELRSKEELVEIFKGLLDETFLQHPFTLEDE